MKLYYILLLLFSASAFAVNVAFMEIRSRDGKIIQLEPGGRFAHVAISYGPLWLHSHPQTGVQLTSDLSSFGRVSKILTNPTIADPSFEQVQALIGKKYDFDYSWSDQAYYCSELVAKLLGISPTAMTFSGPAWTYPMDRKNEELGISPDDIFLLLNSEGWKEINVTGCCVDFLQKKLDSD